MPPYHTIEPLKKFPHVYNFTTRTSEIKGGLWWARCRSGGAWRGRSVYAAVEAVPTRLGRRLRAFITRKRLFHSGLPRLESIR